MRTRRDFIEMTELTGRQDFSGALLAAAPQIEPVLQVTCRAIPAQETGAAPLHVSGTPEGMH